MFAGIVFAGSRLVCGPFSELTSIWGPVIFVWLYIFLAGVQLTVFKSSRLLAYSLKPSRLLPSTWCRCEEHPFSLVPRLRRRFGISSFFLVTLNWYSNSSVTGWPRTLVLATQRSSACFRRFTVCCFVPSFFSLSLSIYLYIYLPRS